MARIFCIANQKGGVGKTTTTVNLAAALAQIGKRVMVIDLDPQGNATMGSGIDKRKLELSVYDVLLENANIAEVRQRSPKGGYDVVGANRELAGAEVELVALERRERRLRQALAPFGSEYDVILIDCPPSLSLLTLNGLCCAHGVVVPMQCEYFALEGLSDLVNTIRQVHANLNPELKVIGLLRVMFDARITLQQQVTAIPRKAGEIGDVGFIRHKQRVCVRLREEFTELVASEREIGHEESTRRMKSPQRIFSDVAQRRTAPLADRRRKLVRFETALARPSR